jgi:hypothetical protein
MSWYPRIHAAAKRVLPTHLPTQAANLARSVSALLVKRTTCLPVLVRTYPHLAPEYMCQLKMPLTKRPDYCRLAQVPADPSL